MTTGCTEWSDKTAPVVILVGGIQTTLTAKQEKITSGTTQVFPNAECAVGFTSPKSATLTTHIIKP